MRKENDYVRLVRVGYFLDTKEQCFLVWDDRRGRGVTVLRRDKTELLRGGGRRWWYTGRWVTNVL